MGVLFSFALWRIEEEKQYVVMVAKQQEEVWRGSVGAFSLWDLRLPTENRNTFGGYT